MADCKPVSTPMEIGCKLTKSDDSPVVNQSEYRSMIGSLLYLTASRPDLMFAVCLVSRFQSAPKQSLLNAVKRIFRYVQGTLDYGLWYPRNNDFTLVGFTDSDWASCLDDRKSTSGAAFFLGDCLVAWHSKKQDCVTLSTAESEYIAATALVFSVWYVTVVFSATVSDIGIHSNSGIQCNIGISTLDIGISHIELHITGSEDVVFPYRFAYDKVQC
ncbi:secreted RxLR effector protein 161-like [Cryptomeria japonica]|uniref:secreted RxLR effector protein 161-like n=1 Tax=Cryptomeria japonica TaxID=3369 RepID=UPI0027D9E488|nr:secreted RxLR effector protein 161-like [Cryptomeria japonica]